MTPALLLSRVTRRGLGGLCAALLAGTVVQAQLTPQSVAPLGEPRPVVVRDPLTAEELRVVGLFERAAPSVAYITTEVVQTNLWLEREVSQSTGSGFLWDTQGHVVTNHHVIAQARRVFVQMDAGKEIEATVVGRAPEYDLAVIRLSRVPVGLQPLPLGESRSLRIGQTVYAIGNPFGLQRTLTRGLVSALDRELPTVDYHELAGVIQTDAAINPGNSGGPLLDSAGRLIGVNTAIRSASSSSSGISFSIPVDLVNRIVPALIAKGRAPLPGLGITPVRPDIVARSGIVGVVLARLDPNGPAARAGLVPYNPRNGDLGDVIVGVNGKPIQTFSELVGEVDRLGIDNTVELSLQRHAYPQPVHKRVVRVKVADLRR